jgi:hypothetical protein
LSQANTKKVLHQKMKEEKQLYCKRAISQEEYDVARAEYAMKAKPVD